MKEEWKRSVFLFFLSFVLLSRFFEERWMSEEKAERKRKKWKGTKFTFLFFFALICFSFNWTRAHLIPLVSIKLKQIKQRKQEEVGWLGCCSCFFVSFNSCVPLQLNVNKVHEQRTQRLEDRRDLVVSFGLCSYSVHLQWTERKKREKEAWSERNGTKEQSTQHTTHLITDICRPLITLRSYTVYTPLIIYV